MIHALPGMGADHRMYPTPWEGIPDFVAHDWVKYTGQQTLADIAQSMCEACRIEDGDDFVGASFGGMVACEIAKIRQLNRVYLIGSAICREEISALLTVLHPLAQVAPIEWIRSSAGKVPTELARMFTSVEPAFIRAMSAAVFKWEGLGSCTTTVFRIHGRNDFVIPPPKSVDLLLDGGHLISMTHARECSEFVTTMSRSSRGASPPAHL